MGFPESRNSLENAGYRFDTMGVCEGHRCQQEIAWFWTRKGKRIPLNANGTGHWMTCVDAMPSRRRTSRVCFVKD